MTRYVRDSIPNGSDLSGLEVKFTGGPGLIKDAKDMLDEAIEDATDPTLKSLLKQIRDSKQIITIEVDDNIVKKGKGILIGAYDYECIDMADIRKFPKSGAVTQQSTFVHEVVEQWLKQVGKKDIVTAHREAMEKERLCTGYQRISDDQSPNADGTATYTMLYVSTKGGMKIVVVKMVVDKEGNIGDVDEKEKK